MQNTQIKRCNRCGREFYTVNNILKEEYIWVEKKFGYFSGKDGEKHSFCLCEKCYDEIVKEFMVPVEIENITEIM